MKGAHAKYVADKKILSYIRMQLKTILAISLAAISALCLFKITQASRLTKSLNEYEEKLSATSNANTELKSDLKSLEADLKERIEDLRSSSTKETSRQKTELDLSRDKNESLQKELDKAIEALEKIKKDFDAYKEKYRVSLIEKIENLRLSKLTLTDGSYYEKVKVTQFTEDTMRIMHSSGAAAVETSMLRDEFLKTHSIDLSVFKPKAIEMVVATNPQAPVEVWSPKSIDDVVACSLRISVDGIATDETKQSWDGSAFLCNHGRITYLYTNAHNLDGAKDVVFTYPDGRKVDDFVSMEIAKSPYGYYKEFGSGGDVVRIRLKNYRPKALTMATKDISVKSLVGSDIHITGNTRGRGAITKLSGKITGLVPRNIIQHNVLTQQGNSGSPIVRASDYKVIGILTWGAYNEKNPIYNLWSKASSDLRDGINYGPLLYDFQYEQTSLKRLRKQRNYLFETRKLARLLGLLDAIEPKHAGLFYNKNGTVQGKYSLSDIVIESSGHPAVNRLINLDKHLAKRNESSIKYSNADILKFYSKTLSSCLQDIVADRQSIETHSSNMHYFYSTSLEKSQLLKVCRAYEKELTRVIAWYTEQGSTSGKPMPLSERVRLPSIEGGYEKYFKEE